MHDLALLLIAAAAAALVATATRLPVSPLYLLAGAILARVGDLDARIGDQGLAGGGDVVLLLVLGASVLVFVAGSELAPGRTWRSRSAGLRVAVGQFIVLGVGGAAAGLLLGLGSIQSSYLALALAASSTLVGVRLLHVGRVFYEPVGRLVASVLLLQDLFVVALIPLTLGLAAGIAAGAKAVAATLALGLATLGIRAALGRDARRDDGLNLEARLLVALSLLALFLAAGEFAGLPPVTGAFLAGFALAPVSASAQLRPALQPLDDFGRALFFTTLGAVVPVFGWLMMLQTLALTGFVVLCTLLVVTALAEWAGFTARTGVLAGLLLGQTSEFSLIVVLVGVTSGHVTPELFTLVTLVTVVTMALTPFLARPTMVDRLVRLHPQRRLPPPSAIPDGHILIIGCGTNGGTLVDVLLLEGRDLTVIEQDPAVVAELQGAGIRALRGDAADPAVVRQAAPERAAAILSTLGNVHDARWILDEWAQHTPVLVRVFGPDEVAWVEARGGISIDYAAATADEFMHWWVHQGPTNT